MLPQQEMNDREYTAYEEGYQEKQTFTQFPPEHASEHWTSRATGEKVYPLAHNHHYLFRFAIAALSMATLLALMIICLIFVGGAGGWISFIIASCVILGVAIAALASTNATSKQP